MSKLNINSMDIHQFCDIQGISSTDKIVLVKKYKEDVKSYNDWYTEVSVEFRISEKKSFAVKEEKDKTNNNKK